MGILYDLLGWRPFGNLEMEPENPRILSGNWLPGSMWIYWRVIIIIMTLSSSLFMILRTILDYVVAVSFYTIRIRIKLPDARRPPAPGRKFGIQWSNGAMTKWINDGTNASMNQWINKLGINESINQWTHQWMNETRKEWNEWTIEWLNEWMECNEMNWTE